MNRPAWFRSFISLSPQPRKKDPKWIIVHIKILRTYTWDSQFNHKPLIRLVGHVAGGTWNQPGCVIFVVIFKTKERNSWGTTCNPSTQNLICSSLRTFIYLKYAYVLYTCNKAPLLSKSSFVHVVCISLISKKCSPDHVQERVLKSSTKTFWKVQQTSSQID